jgi:epoxyqueuosine reductase
VPSDAALEEAIKAQAHGLGFDLVGITSTGPADTAAYFEEWLAEGHAGAMAYLERNAHLRRDSRLPHEGALSAIVVGLDYGGREPAGPVARYARGDDYHELMWAKLNALQRWIEERVGHPVRGRGYVDTGPILERDLARRAGLGWFGKNTNLINPGKGSFFFLGALLLELALTPDEPFEADRCGTCTRCLEACPTNAFTGPRRLDATRCISYLTIELRDAIPMDLREPIGENLYGCDICQDVCPWNVRFASAVKEPAFRARTVIAGKDGRALARDVLQMDEERYREAFRGSAMKRAKLRGLRRNAAVVLGNSGSGEDEAVLRAALDDPDLLVREHAAWALARLAGDPALRRDR